MSGIFKTCKRKNNMNEEIRVLYISHERKMGGANRSLFDLACEMKNRGIYVCVVVLYRGCPIDRKLREAGIDTVACIFGWWQQPENWNFILKVAFRFLHLLQVFTVNRICRIIKRKKINIIHSNSSTIDIGLDAAKKTGCRHVMHFREFGSVDYNLEYMFGRKNSVSFINSYSDCNIFISKALSLSYPDVDNKKIIYNGISGESFGDAVCLKRDEKVIFLMSGNIIKGKNQMLLLKATDILNKRSLKDSFEVLFAGATTDLIESKEYAGELDKYVKENNIENVSFLGYVNDMKELREKVDIEIVPSKCEAYGRVTIEAMASKHIVIASNTGANVELIEDGITGFLFDINNAGELADKMEYCINNRNNLQEMTDRAYDYASKNHMSSKNVSSVFRIYCDLIDEERGIV